MQHDPINKGKRLRVLMVPRRLHRAAGFRLRLRGDDRMSTSPVMSITDEMVAELEAEALMSTLGIWTAEDSPVGGIYISGECDEFICGEIDHVHDANFIALANPATILALLAERKELVRDRERLDWLADPDNMTGNVQLPIKCVTENVHSLRAAIDAAMVKA